MGMCESKEDSKISSLRRKNSRSMKIKPLKKSQGLMTQKELRDFVMANFDKYDTTGDGCLDKSELTVFFKDVLDRKKNMNGLQPEELAVRFIHMVDLDGDQKLTREEIYKFYKEG